MKAQGKTEVAEAVLIAVLSAVAVGLIEWGFEAWREQRKPRKGKKGRKG